MTSNVGTQGDQPNGTNTRFGQYAEAWLVWRPISGRTRDHYRRLIDAHILPTFAATDLRDITPAAMHTWYVTTATGTPTVRRHAYSLMRLIMAAALADNLIDTNPCQITGVSTSHQADRVPPATADEIEPIFAAMPEAYRALILLAAWLAMPYSELGELRRKDIDLAAQVVQVRRAVALVDGSFKVTTPKSTEGIRDIPLRPHVASTIEAHLRKHVQPGRESLLFPSVRDPDRYLSPSLMYQMFDRARAAADRPDLRVPDLRRSGAVLAGLNNES